MKRNKRKKYKCNKAATKSQKLRLLPTFFGIPLSESIKCDNYPQEYSPPLVASEIFLSM